jgi:hypothetical protein
VCVYVLVADGFLVVFQPENLIVSILLGDLVDLTDRLFHLQGVYVNLVGIALARIWQGNISRQGLRLLVRLSDFLGGFPVAGLVAHQSQLVSLQVPPHRDQTLKDVKSERITFLWL